VVRYHTLYFLIQAELLPNSCNKTLCRAHAVANFWITAAPFFFEMRNTKSEIGQQTVTTAAQPLQTILPRRGAGDDKGSSDEVVNPLRRGSTVQLFKKIEFSHLRVLQSCRRID